MAVDYIDKKKTAHKCFRIHFDSYSALGNGPWSKVINPFVQ